MANYSYYEELRDRGSGESAGNVIAVDMGAGTFVHEGGVAYKAVCPAPNTEGPNSAVTIALFNAEYLGASCRPVTEARAREVHPALFEFLEKLH